MKLRIVATALLIMLFSLSAVSEASARPWGYRGGWGGPRIGVRVGIPAPVIVADGYGGGYYGDHGYNGGGYAYGEPRYYGHPYYGGGYYRGGYAHGGGCYRGGGYGRGGYEHGGGYGHGGGWGGRR
jgi:hypothetical protein